MPDPLHPMGFIILLGFLLTGYVVGSVPFGLVISRAFGLPDPRSYGSQNIGATNILRSGHKLAALFTLIGDSGKGGIATALTFYFYGTDPALAMGFGAFMGHLHPIFLRFKGGKGVATFLGVIVAMGPSLVGPLTLGFWLLGALATRRSSMGAVMAALAAPVLFYLFGHVQLAEWAMVMALWLLWRHRQNIGRLVQGTEPKIGAKKP
ncbi:MAG: glycerol-3-phosphate 1-O-acyltransferase [SAR116 cluster bacterium]|nr:acyl-phosphate glycerol 3-phosphate acyltransferase [Paracoccaceae bacterium]RCL80641.1 MAG: glycerol-3-phosphate 1-O-acyltransferase [SAR116 cluster bacterium]HCJ61573.1 acyl-phosphate glycerol 3-phosphate acyltransferase [Alphaproteobacteria bacterium]|tara:strand:- start:787 stop:1407 length:621 start_codon:yes stop_codon:yes gene_type:complete